ncbi:Uncharacterised protein [Mycobacteroides abscessus subsp. abscessus]|nr:Uncharacterised protein [Mycobacteroides abscessus subsp. abscessus]
MADAAFAVTFGVIGFGAILIQLVQQITGRPPKLFRCLVPGGGDQVAFALGEGDRIDPQRNLREERRDFRDVLDIDRTLSQGSGHQLPHRAQRLPGDRRPWTQMVAVPHPATRFLAADAEPDMQDLRPVFGADVFGRGLGLGGGQDAVIDRFGRALQGFAAGLQCQQRPHVQAGVVQGGEPSRRGFVGGVRLLDDGWIGQSHIRTIVRSTDKKPRFGTPVPKVTNEVKHLA